MEKSEEQILQEKLAEIQKAKTEACATEINEVLKKHGFNIDVQYQIVLTPNNN